MVKQLCRLLSIEPVINVVISCETKNEKIELYDLMQRMLVSNEIRCTMKGKAVLSRKTFIIKDWPSSIDGV